MDLEINDRFARIWRVSRDKAGVSQDVIAKRLGVSKKTVQNWEAGASSPSQVMGFKWFKALGIQPLPYYLSVLYPGFGDVPAEPQDKEVDEYLQKLIADLPARTKRELLYMLSGYHGSSVVGVMEMVTAHLQAPLRDRVNVAQSIETNYTIAEANGRIRCPGHVQPDTGLLQEMIRKGKEAVLSGKEEYTTDI